jgi:hypothetical protein
MLKLINNSTAFYGSGLSLQKKLFKIKTGSYAGRIVALYPTTPSTIMLSYSDPPYLSWSTPYHVTTDSADYPAGCWMDTNGDIYVAYTADTSLNLMHKKLNFVNGYWSAGNTATIYNADSNYYPGLFKDYYGRLWVCWTRFSGGTCSLHIKISGDEGDTWDFGPDDEGLILATGQNSIFGRFEYLSTYLYCFYTIDENRLANKRIHMNGATWESEVELYNGLGLGDNFHTSVSDDLKIALAFAPEGDLYFKEFDGAVWSGNIEIDSDVSVAPAVKHNGSTAFVFYGKEIGQNQNQFYYCMKSGTGFTSPSSVTGALAVFDKVMCYRPEAMAKYYDRSAPAADDSGADVYHPDSGKLLKDEGDALLLGQFEKFSQVHISLSTAGSGGAVTWHYWDGSNWKNFVPVSGEYNFDSTPSRIRLWQDTGDMPSDWQSSVVAGHSKFWIKVVVSSDFAAAPVGSQITSAEDLPFVTSL